jgi:hypothetical protein
MKGPAIVASMLGADYARLGHAVAELEAASVDRIQWDIMDWPCPMGADRYARRSLGRAAAAGRGGLGGHGGTRRRRGLRDRLAGRHRHPDVAVDRADQIDRGLNLIKGHGGALLREKLVVAAAARFVVVAERVKLVIDSGKACSCRSRWCASPGPRRDEGCWRSCRRRRCGSAMTALPLSPTRTTTFSTASCPPDVISWNSPGRLGAAPWSE